MRSPMPPLHSPIPFGAASSPPVAWVARRTMEPTLPTLLIWTLLMVGPVPAIQFFSHRPGGSRHDS